MGYRALKYVIPLQSSYVFFLEFLRIFLPQGGFIYYTNNIVYFCFLMERYVCVMAALKKTQRNVHLLVKSPYQNFPLFFSVLVKPFNYLEKHLRGQITLSIVVWQMRLSFSLKSFKLDKYIQFLLEEH